MASLKDLIINKEDKVPVKTTGTSSAYNPFETLNKAYSKNIVMDFLQSDTGVSNEPLHIDDVEKYKDYDVYVNDIDTKEDLDRERAKNQSFLEQAVRAHKQLGVDIPLGMFIGISDLIDSAVELVNGKDSDYSNEVSKYLTEVQENFKNDYAIYRENPDATFDVFDSGWWTDNFVNIGTSLSLLLPSTGVAKGASLIGKGLQLGKVSRGIAKIANKVNAVKYPATFAKNINNFAEVATASIASRTMEGYLEARDVWNTTYENSLEVLNNFTKEEKETFFKNNPDLVGKTNDEIARYIAGESADKTFINDSAMLLMDFLQFKSINSLWKGVANKASTANLRLTNQKAIQDLTKKAEDTISEITKKDKFIEGLTYSLKHPLKSIPVNELGEGFEEFYQGIQTEKGKEVAQQIFNPNYITKDIEDYISDPALWEQAVWGVINGIAFQKGGEFIGDTYNKIKTKLNEKHLIDEHINSSKLADEKIREQEILDRDKIIKEFTTSIERIDKKQNPFKLQEDPFYNTSIVNEEHELHEKIENDEKDLYKEIAVNRFLKKLAENAVSVGNYDLLKEFISAKNVSSHLQKLGVSVDTSTKTFEQALIDKMDYYADSYTQALMDVVGNVDIDNEYTARKTAQLISNTKIEIDEAEQKIAYNDEIISSESSDIINSDNYFQQQLTDTIKSKLDGLDARQLYFDNLKNTGKISPQAHKKYTNEINSLKQSYLSTANRYTTFGKIDSVKDLFKQSKSNRDLTQMIVSYNEFYADRIKAEVPKDSVEKAISDKIHHIIDIAEKSISIPETRKDYIDLYNDTAQFVDKLAMAKYTKAQDDVVEWIKSQDDLSQARKDLYANNVPDNIKEHLDVLKLGHASTLRYASYIDEQFKAIAEDRANAPKKEKSTIDGVEADDVSESLYAASGSSTGQGTESGFAVTTDVDNSINELTKVDKINQQIEPLSNIQTPDYKSARVTQVIVSLYKNDINKNLFDSFVSIEETKDIFDQIVKLINDKLKEQNIIVSKEDLLDGIEYAIKALKKHGNYTKLEGLANTIASRLSFDEVNSSIDYLSDDELDSISEQFIEEYIKFKNINTRRGKKVIIDLNYLLKDLVNNDNIGFDVAKHILYNLKDYINKTSDKYVFVNKSLLNKTIKSPTAFFEEATKVRTTKENLASYMHITATNNINAPGYNKAIEQLKVGDKLTVSYMNEDKTSITFKINGVEVGFLGSVQKTNNEATQFELLKHTTNGFIYKVRTENGNYYSNIDDFFKAVILPEEINATELSQIIYDLYSYDIAVQEGEPVNKEWEKEQYRKLSENKFIKDLLESGNFNVTKHSNGTGKIKTEVAKDIYKAVKNILSYEANPTNEEMWDSYKTWIQSVYENYANTYILQQRLNTGTQLQVEVQSIDNKEVKIDDSNETDITSHQFTFEENPVLYVDANDTIVDEFSDTSYSNRIDLKAGSMGMLIQNNNGVPMIAVFTESNKINKPEMIAAVELELTKLLTDYQQGNIGWDALHLQLVKLLGGPKHTTDNIFSGYSVMKDDKRIGLNFNREQHKYSLIIDKPTENVELRPLKFIPNGNTNKSVSYNTYNEDGIKNIVKEIRDKLRFNRTFFALRHKGEKSNEVLENEYIQKDGDGKILITIGGKKFTYNNFAHFVLDQNAFKTNFAGFKITDRAKSIFVDIDKITSPVEGTILTIDDITKKDNTIFNKETPLASKTILDIVGADPEKVKIVSGDNVHNLSIIPEEVYYDANKYVVRGVYKKSEDKIELARKAFNTEKTSPDNLLAVLIHENIHRQFAKESEKFRKDIVLDLIDTYDAFVEAIEKDLSTLSPDSDRYKLAKEIKEKFIIKSNFTIEKYGENLAPNDRRKYNALSYADKRAWFAEEWLTESLTQSKIIDYLNSTDYKGKEIKVDDIEDTNKSIWQKIIDILLKLFGKNTKNIKNNTILAQQYMILGKGTTEIQTPISNQLETDSTQESVQDEPSLDDAINPNQNLSNETQSFQDEYEDLFSSIDLLENYTETVIESYKDNPKVNTNGVRLVENMDLFMDSFTEQDKPLIAKMIANNEIKFMC